MKFGCIPAGGLGTRMQPLGFSKELIPVNGRAVIEYTIERMIAAGIENIFVTLSPDKTDVIRYISEKTPYADNCIFLARERKGLFDGVIQPRDFMRGGDRLYFGLPDTVWFPRDGFSRLECETSGVSLGLFDSGTPEKFDAVFARDDGTIESIKVKRTNPETKWTWGIGSFAVKEIGKMMAISEGLPESEPLMGDVLDVYAKENRAVCTRIPDSSYIDVGDPVSYSKVGKFIQTYDL